MGLHGQDNYPYAPLTSRLVNADAPEQRIDGMSQFANHRPDPPSLDQPLLRTRFPETATPSRKLANS